MRDSPTESLPGVPRRRVANTAAAQALALRKDLRKRQRWLSVAVALVGIAVTAALAVVSEIGYRHNEQRLTTLETKLTATLLGTTPVQLEAQLGRIVGLAAESPQPVATFRSAVASSLAPKGPFASAALVVVRNGKPEVLANLPTNLTRGLNSPASTALFERAARTSSLVTSRAVGRGVQKFGYLLSARGPGGIYVVDAGEEFSLGDRVSLPAGSPAADLNIAIYFGRTTKTSALIETDVTHLPLDGIASKETVPFGANVLTLVVAPRGPLSGPWLELLPWGILIVGVLLTLLGAGMTERLVRRRAYAESLATVNRRLYREQRGVATTLQQSLLPPELPSIPGVDLAARYIPSAKGAEVGGDWYSIIPVSESQFVFVVGDVSGHGVGAAGVMGSLRHTIRTLAKLGFSPSEVLNRASDEIDVGADNHFATVLVGKIDTALSQLTGASAGHLPPLVICGRAASFLGLSVGRPLGVTRGSYKTQVFDFAPGSTLLCFTDGLVERRGESLDTGLDRLAEIASQAGSSADALLDVVTSSLCTAENEDDIAILAIRHRPVDDDLAESADEVSRR